MQKANADHRLDWQPPPRPEWVQRINEEGYCMNISGVVPLDEKSLLESAMRTTGLTDFGADDWREPFRVLVKALDSEAELNLMGRLRTRSELLQLLEARLQIEAVYKQHPEIDDEDIIQPLVIVGQGRSGTSFLHALLAANPDNGAPTFWEISFPSPPPERASYRTDPRIKQGHKLITQNLRVTPTIDAMFPFGGDIPFECCLILALNFMSITWFGNLGQAPSYDMYMMQQDIEPGLRYHKRVLKLLQWKNPRKHWVLKDPMHLDRLVPILKVYPDACFIWPHRDPARALASVVSFLGTVQWGRCDHPFKGGSYEYLLDPNLSAARLNAVIDQLEAGTIPSSQFYNLLYKDLVADTIPTLELMYRHFGIELSDEGRRGVAKYLADHPRDERPSHKFSMAPEAMAVAHKAYKRYQDYFGISIE